jgi:hypothetical protein
MCRAQDSMGWGERRSLGALGVAKAVACPSRPTENATVREAHHRDPAGMSAAQTGDMDEGEHAGTAPEERRP